MSATPASCFDWCKGSGYPVNYGSSTISTNHPIRTYSRGVIEVLPTGGFPVSTGAGGIPGYFTFLDTRYDTPPSGWSQIGQPK